MTKEEKGITLVALTIIIIVLLILAGVGITSGISTIKSARFTKFEAEMQVMQTEINKINQENEDANNLGQELTEEQKQIFNVKEVEEVLSTKEGDIENLKSNFKYFTKDYLKNELKIEVAERDYYINLEERIIISKEPVEYEGTKYYMLEQMPNGMYNVQTSKSEETVDFTLDYKLTSDNKANIIIENIESTSYNNKWKIRYKLVDSMQWDTSAEFQGSSYILKVENSNNYYIQLFHNEEIESEIKQINISGGWDEEKKVNAPMLKDNMELVKYDEETKNWVVDNTNSEYDYIPGDNKTDTKNSKWANAKVTIDGIESYFVWIPRYAYKIDKINKKIDIVFLINDTDKYIDENGKEQTAKRVTNGGNPENEYVVHPAFTKTEENNIKTFDYGEWKDELTGLWIGKYESSIIDKKSKQIIKTVNESLGNIIIDKNNNTDKAITVIPNVTTWFYVDVGNMYTSAKAFSEKLNSHMIKNSEWGVVAYLTHSQYGRNGNEIATNNSGITNDEFYTTGISAGKPDATIDETKYQYNTDQGVLASSTGNIYGVYDLSGGGWEITTGYYRLADDFSKATSFAGKDKKSDEYSTIYEGMEGATYYKIGDATYETHKWNNDYNNFVTNVYPFFGRGGVYGNSNSSGIFSVDNITHGALRLCLTF